MLKLYGGVSTVDPVNPAVVMETKVCCHHWEIESPNGPYSKGVCTHCNEERAFQNFIGNPAEVALIMQTHTSQDFVQDKRAVQQAKWVAKRQKILGKRTPVFTQ